MNQKEISIQITEYQGTNELPKSIVALFLAAEKAAKKAYAPYSNYPVGAAMLLQNGQVVAGCNQENASFPVGICAERVALANVAMLDGKPIIDAIAITVSGDVAAPCGMCRQALLEQEHNQNADIAVYLKGSADQIIRVVSVRDLLPLPFYSKALSKQVTTKQ